MVLKRNYLIGFLICIFFTFGCGQKAQKSQSILDTPEHHLSNGKKLLRVGKTDAAFSEFNRAKELNPKFSPAYAGMGLVYAEKGDFEKALSFMKKADDLTENKNQEVFVLTGFMQIYEKGMNKIDEDWLEEVEDLFEKAVEIAPKSSAAYYFMGVAYKNVFKIRKAEDKFKDVIEINKDYVPLADKGYKTVQKIARAMPKTGIGRKIALLDKISRADMAALLVEELGIDKLMRRKKVFDNSFKSESSMKEGKNKKMAPATDIENHVLKVDIDRVIELGINGLQPYPDHTFQPEVKIIRSEFAMVVADILEKITNDKGLATRFIGSSSPYPDVRNDLHYFNAVMLCTSRGIMEVKDVGSGEFDSQGTISGAEALYSLHILKVQLKK
ncbi:MAG: tetratricopeptide repeat protein [Deltaproteobacteria bacterium]|nr:tetratricopeptide repeat protein [Deltaproteobacteria bacterium]